MPLLVFRSLWPILLGVLLLAWAEAARAEAEVGERPRESSGVDAIDSDGDGITDAVEIESGTSPLRRDTDGDSIPDGVEDANQDGAVDEGESDPRVAGLFPGDAPHIPEPMVFDLVRALGAKKNELEANALVVTRFRRDRPTFEWAPEVEWAIVDDVAVELELPMHERELEAVKVALQVTLPDGEERFVHGVQAIGEVLLDQPAAKTTLLYLAGGRVGRVSLFAMAGARGVTPMDRAGNLEALLNPSVSCDVDERFTVSLESNLALPVRARPTMNAMVLPQVHVQISRHVRAQMGAGVQVVEQRAHGVAAMRWIME